ncbi:MAG: hypothetical protein ACRDRH_24765 [Pseudonocardia sp.]
MTHLVTQLTKKDNLVPLHPGPSAPRTRKRGGSTRYPRRKPDIAPIRNLTHTIVMHPLQPKPT